MNYRVIWRPGADTVVLSNLLRAADKPALWAVVRAADRAMETDPYNASESRDDPRRRLPHFRPFALLFTVDDETLTVHVEATRWVGA